MNLNLPLPSLLASCFGRQILYTQNFQDATLICKYGVSAYYGTLRFQFQTLVIKCKNNTTCRRVARRSPFSHTGARAAFGHEKMRSAITTRGVREKSCRPTLPTAATTHSVFDARRRSTHPLNERVGGASQLHAHAHQVKRCKVRAPSSGADCDCRSRRMELLLTPLLALVLAPLLVDARVDVIPARLVHEEHLPPLGSEPTFTLGRFVEELLKMHGGNAMSKLFMHLCGTHQSVDKLKGCIFLVALEKGQTLFNLNTVHPISSSNIRVFKQNQWWKLSQGYILGYCAF